MAQVSFSQSDTLADLEYQNENQKVDDPKSLRNQVSATDGSITIVSGFGCSVVLSWSFSLSAVNITVELQTPVGNIPLINATLDANNPSITFGGSEGSFKAQGTVSFDVNTLVLTASGEVCAPIVGCKSGSVSVNV